MADDKPTGHPSTHTPKTASNKPSSPADKGPFSATYPADADLTYDDVAYGPDIGTEADYRLLGDVDGRRVLDLGCGAGHNAVALALAGAHVIAVDPYAENLARARESADLHETRIEVHQSDLADLAFVRADSVDLVFSAYQLASVSDLGRVFRQVHRVIRPDMHLVFSLPHPAFALIDPASNDPMRIRRGYWDPTPRDWEVGGRRGADHPHTVTSVFTQLLRSNFRVDTLLEPEPSQAPTSAYHSEVMGWVPATLVVRAQKEGI